MSAFREHILNIYKAEKKTQEIIDRMLSQRGRDIYNTSDFPFLYEKSNKILEAFFSISANITEHDCQRLPSEVVIVPALAAGMS